ncbi:MAG: DUF559 domain-containing protein [Candidatus Competibacteraceae bacterium]|nr:MAG: DUF559 domain-containing protein [Candidatus Competibacteraceae bacterium]
MQPLDKTIRNRLERTIKDARELAEDAARAALEQLGVGEAAPFAHLSEQDRDLRRRLRVHGRQLGDTFLPSPSGRGAGGEGRFQVLDRLIEEVAYEHWHRMLFARFLAENNLLMYPDPDDPVAVTLEECEDLAADEGAANGWELAARFAARMLPQIFRLDSPVFQLGLPPEHQQKLERLVADLPLEVFTASDSLGWVYQFWQAKKKDEVNASEVKIGARELPAVTQLFTEPYMVSFLLDNSLGAWWAARRLTDADLQNASSEEELRRKAAIPGVPLDYLRFVKTSPLNPPSMNGGGNFKNASVTAHNFVTPEKLELARKFRKDPTSKESEVWEWLRNRRMLNLKWRRQQVIEGFIADFYCAEHHLALELDGAIHDSEQSVEYDQIRDNIFAQKGIRTLRISNDHCTHAYLQAQIEQIIRSPSPFMERGPGGEVWTPAAGTFDGWPEQLAELKTLDPCCGSGHFLVAAFLMLVPMRMERDGLSAADAVDAVLRENIHGLELDKRCVALAAFALALTAWKVPNAGGYRVLPELNVACSGLSVSVAKEEWKQLSLGKKNLTIALDWMHDTFKDAPVLGSLLDPAKTDAAKLVQWDELSNALEQALNQEQSEEQQEVAVVAQGLAKAATLLAGRYQWVITNVPYLARGKQDERLRDFCERYYPAAKNDLATVFLDRCLELTSPPNPLSMNGEGELGGTVSVVLPQNWLFLTSYKRFRERLLRDETWHLIARLGPGAFETISGEVVKAILLSLSRGNPIKESGGLFGDVSDGNLILGVDVSEPRTASEKATQLLTVEIKSVEQAKQLENPDARVALEEDTGGEFLEVLAYSHEGLTTGDIDRFVRKFWEIQHSGDWVNYIQNTTDCIHYHGRTDIIHWGTNGEVVADFPGSFIKGKNAWGCSGLRVTQMRHLPTTIYTGEVFGKNAATVIPHNPAHLPAIWCFCSSPEYNEAVRQIDQSLKVTNATLVKVPFDLDYWTRVAEEKYPNGLPKPYTDDPTQWIFHGHPCGSVVWDEEKKWTVHGPLRTDETVLQVAVARLIGYRWPAETSPLNPLSINGEGTLRNENISSSPPSPFMEKGDGGMRLADEQREWVNRCEALASYADDDGIVCIPPVRGEASASDRLLNLLAAAYNTASPLSIHGEGGWGGEVLAALLNSADHAGKTLETWLREKFFTQHCKLFQHRPFIWHIWDGLRDGFAALVNYHKLDAKLLETLIYTYLGDWISRQKQDIASGVDGAQERLAAAEALKKKLELILEGEAPYDIFVRWKPLEQQPIGWDPDLNDGVRLNIRPFLSVPDVGKKDAGILRDKPNINWNKDRGKDVESAPWYHVFNGDRINDHHLTLAEKRTARDKEART